jgi:hypothetical protein
VSRIFLLSPAWCGGKRATLLLRQQAAFPLAVSLRKGGATLGEVFSFLSGLYFRGKLAYARRFTAPEHWNRGVFVITPTRGLQRPDVLVGTRDLEEFADVDIHEADARYTDPLRRDLARLLETHPEIEIVLLGSIATGKYVEVLTESFGERLLFPGDFVGRGDMSRGGLMLRRSRSGEELDYIPVLGAVRHGPRPPRLERIR